MNEIYQKGGKGGYPWSRKEEMKARAISKGWQSVFAGGRSASDASLNTKEFVLAKVALDLIKTQGWLLAFDEVQLVDIAGAGLVSRVLSWYWRLGGVVVATSNRVPEGELVFSVSFIRGRDFLLMEVVVAFGRFIQARYPTGDSITFPLCALISFTRDRTRLPERLPTCRSISKTSHSRN
jgi:hypothetical protein